MLAQTPDGQLGTGLIRVNYQVSYFANPVIFKKFEVAGFNFMLY